MKEDLSPLIKWYENQMKVDVKQVIPLRGGINSTVLRVEDRYGYKVIKSYLGTNNSELRYLRETNFLDFCLKSQVGQVPKILKRDQASRIICIEYIAGEMRASSEDFIKELLFFIETLQMRENEIRPNTLMLAADATLDFSELLVELGRRVIELVDEKESAMTKEIRSKIHDISTSRLIVRAIADFFERYHREVISPSDVGPQNCLWVGESAFFIDFEYAGRDSNIKLGLDLLTHPDIGSTDILAGPKSSFERVFGFASGDVPDGLIRLFKLKWRLIRERKMRKLSRL